MKNETILIDGVFFFLFLPCPLLCVTDENEKMFTGGPFFTSMEVYREKQRGLV